MPNALANPVSSISLREDVAYQQSGSLQVDRNSNTVRNLLLSGLYSKNNRSYLLEAYRDALPLYEGARCNIDHPTPGEKETPFARRFGIYRNVHLTQEGPRADLIYNPAHPMAPAFLWWAENCPEAVGLSHNADGEGQMQADGQVVVTKLHKIHSVDLVADPATSTRGLAEATPMPPLDPMATPSIPPSPPPGNPLAPPGAAGTPMGGAKPDAAGGDSWQTKLADAMKSLMLDDTKSPEDKWAAIEQMFNAVHPKPAGVDSSDSEAEDAIPNDPAVDNDDSGKSGNDKECNMKEDDDSEDMNGKAMEAVRQYASKNKYVRKLLESHDRYSTREKLAKRRTAVIAQCKQANLNEKAITDVFVESLMRADDKTAQKMIEDRRSLFLESTRINPTSAAPGPVGNGEYESFIQGLKSAVK